MSADSTESLGALNAVGGWQNADPGLAGYVCYQLSGTWVGTITWQAYVLDSGKPVTIMATPLETGTAATTAASTGTDVNGIYKIDATGLGGVRPKMTSYTSGTLVTERKPVIG